MSEVRVPFGAWSPSAVPGPAPDETVSQALAARAGRWALRIADLLAARFAAEPRADEAAAFLRTWAGDLQVPAAPAAEPLARLAVRYELSQDEEDLIVLAGLPEEHEGLASTLRTLHPHGEPRVTAGLAALLLGAVTSDRSHIRRLLSEGIAVRAGLIRLTGPGAMFERSLACADQLWDALHGHDAWPDAIERAQAGEAPPGLEDWTSWSTARTTRSGWPGARRSGRPPASRWSLPGSRSATVPALPCSPRTPPPGVPSRCSSLTHPRTARPRQHRCSPSSTCQVRSW